jgi:hypothetical protein
VVAKSRRILPINPNAGFQVVRDELSVLSQLDVLTFFREFRRSSLEGVRASHSFLFGEHAPTCFLSPTLGTGYFQQI